MYLDTFSLAVVTYVLHTCSYIYLAMNWRDNLKKT